MTREELQAIKDKAARATAIVAEIEALERFKSQRDLTKLAGEIGEATNISVLPVDEAQLASVLRAGTETRITQLEQELADITVGEKPAVPASLKRLAENARGFADALETPIPVAVLSDRVSESLEPLIAGGVHP